MDSGMKSIQWYGSAMFRRLDLEQMRIRSKDYKQLQKKTAFLFTFLNLVQEYY